MKRRPKGIQENQDDERTIRIVMIDKDYINPILTAQNRPHAIAVGPNRIQNELLNSFLSREMDINCSQSIKFPGITSRMNGNGGRVYLFLFDCQGVEAFDPWLAFDINGVVRKFGVYLVFYNVLADAVLDQLALDRGIHGVFYLHDPIDMIPKGLKAIMRGELWYRRDILAKDVTNSVKIKIHGDSSICGLTYRQREILRLVVGGASNHSIATSLNISLNTVRCHIYNIYKRINVKNRLQAATWARQNLGVRGG